MRFPLQLTFFQTLLFVGAVGACSDGQGSNDRAGANEFVGDGALESHIGPEAAGLWSSYVAATTSAGALQPGCEPVRVAHRGAYKGLAILFHGFTACPQQYLDGPNGERGFADYLAAEGFEVLLPVLPGHGRQLRPGEAGAPVDDVVAIPTDEGRGAYGQIASDMNAIARAATAPVKAIAGLSVGGAVATSAVAQAPALYQHALIMTPFFGPAENGFWLPVANAVAGGFRMSWGQGCLDERAGGRAGYCDFLITNVRAAQHFGDEVLGALAPEATTRVQVVGVEGDTAALNELVKRAAERLAVPAGAACFFPLGVQHSMLSHYDNPTADKFWLPEVYEKGAAFLVRGENLATGDVSSAEAPYPVCTLANAPPR
jgi:pimeloyl-ACP methyl ester carboxylesterase